MAVQVDHALLTAIQICVPGDQSIHASLAGLLADQQLDDEPVQKVRHRLHGPC